MISFSWTGGHFVQWTGNGTSQEQQPDVEADRAKVKYWVPWVIAVTSCYRHITDGSAAASILTFKFLSASFSSCRLPSVSASLDAD